MQFIDEAKINIEAGNGGRGASSFRREKFIPRGGPDGGDGGDGGDVVFRCSRNLNTLIDFRFQQHFKAKNGEPGQGKNRNGRFGKGLILTVPLGTQIFNDETGELLFDMMEHDEEVIVAKGGKGGLGNVNFKSSTNQAPRYAQSGEEGEKFWIKLKLKLLSDAGLLGMPNAGKSTFLSVVSRARPKIADYPFTTLKPQLGVVYVDGKEFVLADIPGLIKGASKGKGLGDRFLKHVERCGVLLHLLDLSSEDMVENYKMIRSELEGYDEDLLNKPEVIALSKKDVLDEEGLKEKQTKLEKFLKKSKIKSKVFVISAVVSDGMDELLRQLYKEIESYRKNGK